MNDRTLNETIRRIESLSRRDPGGRGLSTHVEGGLLLPAARELHSGERVILITGFCTRSSMIGETDGPSGTLTLADALRRTGKEVVLVTDRFSAPLLAAGSAVLTADFPVVSLDLPQAATDREIEELVSSFAPSHVVAIEHPGSAADGHRYSMRGEVLDDIVPATDRLLAPLVPRRYRTLAIGDGGNELGMGGLRERVKGWIAYGDLVCCVTPADHVIPAGISNWGAFALSAALSLLSGKLLIRPSGHERALLEAILAAGAVDGSTGRSELSVDGLSWNDYAGTLDEIYRETRDALAGC